MSAATAQQAALRILLEDIEPLLQRAEAAAANVQAAREGLATDLAALATLVQRSIDTPSALLETGRRLDSAAARIEAAVAGHAPARVPGVAMDARAPHGRWRTGAGAAVLLGLAGALCGAGATLALARDDLADARLGRALQRGWALLDVATRAKVEAVLRR